jgi:hypothetical protein
MSLQIGQTNLCMGGISSAVVSAAAPNTEQLLRKEYVLQLEQLHQQTWETPAS